MAKVKIQGHASGTGVLTVTAPNTSTDRTITLPDATGTLLNSDGDGSNLTGINLNAVTGNLTVSGNITGGNNGSIFLLDNAGQKSGEIQTDSSAANALQIDADPDNSASGSYTAFRVDNTERMRITPDGLTFNGDTATANALNDYEEGTWTPSLGGYSSRAGTWSNTVGFYTKIGNTVNLFFGITGSGMYFSSERGYQYITGMPFTAVQPTYYNNYSGTFSGDSVDKSVAGAVYLRATEIYMHSANDNWSTAGVDGIGCCVTYTTNS